MQLKEIREGDINVRAGILITDKISVLGCLPTASIQYPNYERRLDLPKGHLQEGEDPLDAAIRECWEETNIHFKKWKLKFVGTYSLYSAPFYLYCAVIRVFPELRLLSCPSTFKKDVLKVPENSSYELVKIENISNRFFSELVPIIESGLSKR